jgi:hypothetical protein
MMSQAMFNLAQRAAADTSLMAHLIEQQAKHEEVSWEELASKLTLKPAGLAKLALCHKPRESFFAQDVAQIVGYSGINRVVLLHLLDCTKQGLSLKKRTLKPTPSVVKQSKSRFMLSMRTVAWGFAAMLLLLVGTLVMAQPGGSEATLVVTAGEAVVNQAGGGIFSGTSDSAVSAGGIITVAKGDTIRLAETAVAQLRLQDGSTVDLSGGTTLSVAELISTDDSYRVQLDLLSGRVLNRVVRLLKPEDAFEIKTPSSTASVRGTVFSVEVQANDVSHVVVTEGVVRVFVGNRGVDVPAGFQITAIVGQPLRTVPIAAAPANTPAATEAPSRAPTAAAVPMQPPTPTNTAVPPEKENPTSGTPTRVPGKTPTEVSGSGNPPQGGASPPGQTNPDDDNDDAATPTPTAVPTNTHTSMPTSTTMPANTPVPTSTAIPTSTPVLTDTPSPEPTATSDTGGGKVTICHLPEGDIEKGITLEIDVDSLDDHLAHGDLMGACP